MALVVALFIDSYAITAATRPYHDSTVGEWLINPYGFVRRTSCQIGGQWAVVAQVDDGTAELLIDPTNPPDPKVWRVQFAYRTYSSQFGFYAPTRARRSSQLWITNTAIASEQEFQGFVDRYVDHIAANYNTPLQNRGALDGLRSGSTAFSAVPSFERRSVGETNLLWPGVLHNTLAAAALLALLISTPWSLCTIPGRVRRWRWKCTGHCLNCGNDITGVPVAPRCPECGSPYHDSLDAPMG